MGTRKNLSIIAILLLFPAFALAAHAKSTPSAPLNGPRIYLRAGDFDPLIDNGPVSIPDRLRNSSMDKGNDLYQVVQFHGPVTTANQKVLVSHGIEILDYIPDYAYVVRMPGMERSTIQELPEVRWVGLYQPAFRLSPDLYTNLYQPAPNNSIDLAVDVFSGVDLDSLISIIESYGGDVTDQAQTGWKSKLILSMPAGKLLELITIPGIRWIEPAPEWRLTNDIAVGIMNVQDVWNTYGLYGDGQTVGICDSGLDKGSTSPGLLHDDFENGSGGSRVSAIFDVAGDGNAADVNNGHGTHVAGSVLGNGANSGSTPSSHTYPVTAYAGVAPEANLVFQASEVNSTGEIIVPPDLNDLFAQAAASGADLHTNSWGSPGPGLYTANSAEVDQYIWDHPDFPILYAAGNDGTDSNNDGIVDLMTIASPGTAKNIITVGASENVRPDISWATWGYLKPSVFSTNPISDDLAADNANGMSAFSSRGPTQDGRIKPDLVAPGTFIISTKSSLATGTGWGLFNQHYFYMGGTSMSTPLAAGAAAIVRQYYTDLQLVTPSAALIKATLVNGATDIYPGQYPAGATQEILTTRPTNVAGWGRVDLENSIFPDGGQILSYRDQKTGLETGEIDIYTFTVTSASQPLKITLAWSDYPATPAAGQALVNDLDLTIISPTPTHRYMTNGSADRLNNLEGIDIQSPQLGTYTILVSGYNVPQGPQPYALVVSGILGNTPPIIYDLPDQQVIINKTLNNAIDLWDYTWDPQSPDQELTFSIVNSANPDVINAGVTLDSNRYIDLTPVQDWTGEVLVEIKATDSGGLYGVKTFMVVVSNFHTVYLPLMLSNFPPPLKAGYWASTSGWFIEFDVTDNGYSLENFTVTIDVPGCNLYAHPVTKATKVIVTDYQFSFDGTYYATGVFDTLTSASGTFGLDKHQVSSNCWVTGGPFNWTATWQTTR